MAERKDTNVEITLKNVRLSFANVFKPQQPRPDRDGKISGEPSYNSSFLIPKNDSRQLDMVEDAIAECKKKMWGDNPPKIRNDRTPYKDGDDYEYDGYPGNMVISARNPKAPQVVHSKKDDDGKYIRLRGDEGVVYSGCYVNAILRFWAQDSVDYGKRINCSLEVVQFYDDGEAFGGASRPDADEALKGLENKDLKDDDLRRGGDSRRDGDRDRGRDRDERSSRDRDNGSDRDRGSRSSDDGRGRDRNREETRDRGERSNDDRGSRSSGREDRGDDDRGSRSSRDEAGSRDSGRGSRGSDERDRGSDRGDDRSRSRDERDDRGRDRDRGEERGSRDAGSSRERDRGEGREGSRERSSDRDGRDADRSSSGGRERDREPSGDRGRDRNSRDLI